MSRTDLLWERAGEAGLTLIELLCGVSITIILLCAAMTGVAQHQAQRRVHGEQILAMSACRNTMETLRSVPITALPSYHGRGFDVPGQDGQAHGLTAVPNDLDGLAGEIYVTADRTAGTTTLYRVRTRVHWQGVTRGGVFEMECLMGERR